MYTEELGSELLALFQELMPDLKADKAELLRRIEAMMCPRASRSPVGHHQTNACSIVNTSFETAALRHLVKQQKLFQQTDAAAHGDSAISTQLVDASAPYNYVRPLPLSKKNRDQTVVSEAYKASLSSVAPKNPSVPQGLPSNELVTSEALDTYRQFQVLLQLIISIAI
ncbi:unnamed protein product [Dibothriocephalus latus]|uniref:Uncharacterized protein n=1 Tax=Dibothriocephalus latus TaxID=60516 RepID=A0A3P7NDM4_DIBLA|nr:unnamed protein product [Dibothriocephalus latus]